MGMNADKYNTPQWHAFRQACLIAGIRTLGADFNGSSDEGSVDSLVMPNVGEEHRGLQELLDEHGVLDIVYATTYDYVAKKHIKRAIFETLDRLCFEHFPGQGTGPIESLFYDILEYFPGDWVNNEGGYGTVWLDLQNGQWTIDGQQRISSTEPASADGHCFQDTVLAADPVDNTADFVKSILGA